MILFLFVIFNHWVADFILQSRWMATNKSTSNKALASHVLIYSLAMIPSAIAFDVSPLWFFIITFITHFCTDYGTSRLTSYFWKKEDVHKFFIVIGFDQVIHYVTLVFTIQILIGT